MNFVRLAYKHTQEKVVNQEYLQNSVFILKKKEGPLGNQSFRGLTPGRATFFESDVTILHLEKDHHERGMHTLF